MEYADLSCVDEYETTILICITWLEIILCFDYLSVLGPQYNEDGSHSHVCRSWMTNTSWNINVIHVQLVFTHEIGF